MKNIQTKKEGIFDNKVQLVGRITKKDEFINLVPFPIFGLEIEVPIEEARTSLYQFAKLEEDVVSKFFYFRVIFFNNETIINDVEIGDMIAINGELQSRNFSQQHPMTDDLLQSSVDIFQNLFNILPVLKEPTQHMRQPINWKKLIDMNLLDSIPNDSRLDENNLIIDESNKPYIYKLNWNGEVTKETEESILEVISFEYKKVETIQEIDSSLVLISGRISDKPTFEIEDGNIFTQFKVQTFQRSFEPKEKRFVFVKVKIVGLESQDIFNAYKKNDFISVAGALVSERKDFTFKIKKITSSNKIKKKKVTIKKTDRFILTDANHLKKQ